MNEEVVESATPAAVEDTTAIQTMDMISNKEVSIRNSEFAIHLLRRILSSPKIILDRKAYTT